MTPLEATHRGRDHRAEAGPVAARQGERILAQALFAEAGGRPVRAIEALAATAVNRARLAATDPAARLRFAPGAPARPAGPGRPEAWPTLLGPVCRAPFFLRSWRGQRAGGGGGGTPSREQEAPGDAASAAERGLEICGRIAARAAAGALPDPTNGATLWHDAAELPGWTSGLMPTALIAGLVFYRA